MKTMKKNLIVVLVLFAAALFYFQGGSRNPSIEAQLNSDKRVAACPTFHYKLDLLEDDYHTIKTRSTSWSLNILSAERADFVISGRKLKPQEPEFSYKVINNGFSFIGPNDFTITEDEMSELTFFTDQNKQDILNTFNQINPQKLFKVNNVYDYLNEGVAITSYENTDYSKAGVVGVFRNTGERLRESRTPVVYFNEKDEKEAETLLKALR